MVENVNNLDTSLVTYVINTFFSGYREKHFEDMYSWGLEALHKADKCFDQTKTNKPFKYYATCIIRRAIFGFVRDRIPKITQYITYVAEEETLEYLCDHEPSIEYDHLYTALKNLKDDYKKLIYLRFYLGLSMSEIAKKLSITVGSLHNKYKRIFKKLKEKITL
jgi:RNA polymerase sigma factor (sigma-70 family)